MKKTISNMKYKLLIILGFIFSSSYATGVDNVTDISKIDGSSLVWLTISGILVFFMAIPGIGLFYGGMVRKKNVIATVMKSFVICGIISILWICFGYTLTFTTGNSLYGNLSHIF